MFVWDKEEDMIERALETGETIWTPEIEEKFPLIRDMLFDLE